MKETRHMSENTTWRDIVQAVSRLESSRDSYERGHRDGRKDEREHAKTLRNPDRLAEIQQLQEALRRKNEKHWRLRAQYKRLKDSKRPRARAYICKKRTWSGHWVWVAHIRAGARHWDDACFSTHHEALKWALAQLKEEQ